MKYLLLIITALFVIFPTWIAPTTYAAEGEITVTVTEKVPGARCDEVRNTEGGVEKITYTCHIQKGFGTVVTTMGKIIKYFTFIVALGGVLALVIGGIMYSMGGANDEMKTKSKEFITKVIFGLVLLLFSGVILNAIAPWVYK